MRCDRFKRELAGWLEAVWDIESPVDGSVPGELVGHAEKCPECRRRLETALSLVNRRIGVDAPSPLLVERIHEKLTGSRPASRNRTVLYSALAAALAVTLIAVGLLAGPFRGGGNGGKILVKFSLEAPLAKHVYVVGDWNDWNSAADPLFDRDSDGVWEAEVTLEPGREYRYQFYIDGSEWIADPNAPLKIDDGFGGQNSILKI